MNPVAQMIRQMLLLLSTTLPENLRPFLNLVAMLVGNLNIPVSDPRIEKVAELVAQLAVDIQNLGALEDADARMKARLLLENRFHTAWAQLSLEAGI